MGQIVQLDATTLLIKSNDTSDLEDIVSFVFRKDEENHKKMNGQIHSFLEFAAQNKLLGKHYQFNREECYGQ